MQLVLERCACKKGSCERREGGDDGSGGDGGGGVLVSVRLGIIYQFYCFLVLLLAAIAPHLALLLLLNLAPIPAAASLRYVLAMQLKVRSSG